MWGHDLWTKPSEWQRGFSGGCRAQWAVTNPSYVSQVITSPQVLKGKWECKLRIGSPSLTPSRFAVNVTPGHSSVHQSESWVCFCPPKCLAYIPSVISRAARQSQSGSITITQQLCVFVEDYIFKRTPGEEGWGAEESSVTDCEGAHSRVQKAEAPTSVTLLCGKINTDNM